MKLMERPAAALAGGTETPLIAGRYRQLEKIGTGSTATVHLGHDALLGRHVAIKMIQTPMPAVPSEDAEVQALTTMQHPGVVTLFDAMPGDLREEGTSGLVLILEFVDGPDLRCLLRNEGALPEADVAALGIQLADALDYVHSRQVIHRDLKPANILLAKDDREGKSWMPKLADFGISRSADPELTLEDAVAGTPAYLSPEQIKGEQPGTPSDIYSLGLILLQCFTGEMAFPGPPLESAIARTLSGPELPDGLPRAWRSLLTSMTDPDPAARPAAADIAHRLRTRHPEHAAA
ncbi:serine/threonine-protein kinase [Pseudarthrobacter sp. J75]|uniref:serine/threonine-protein kinase n=1 Tax=unclassified Pseudarthrobacter TaxID=2647000 RepID=UPI002E803903|nr:MULTISPECIES: serine/threonine-protein kinase [unclassified Pseudarthrobacter]MEE2523139.1 serine/threonine-protein kinase [Pseudarthrobacter sp. J47]MEE2529823.1 serine/threonine-protein kinase [Pseudarthrobacter sp. J75]